MLASMLLIVLILLGACVLHYLIGKFPFDGGGPYKAAAQYVVLFVAVVWVCVILYGLVRGLA